MGDARVGEVAAMAEERMVEARILEQLQPLMRVRWEGRDQRGAPPPYVRRHVAEHAAAAGLLEQVVTETEFLPFVDAARLRALSSVLDPAWSQEARAGLRVWRAAAHCWSWEMPGRNASTLSVWRIAAGLDALHPANDRWRTRWGWWPLGGGEVLARHTNRVDAVACMVLPGGQPVAVTGCDDGTVRVWDLATGTPAGELAGHTGPVVAVACTVLPGGQPVAVTGSDDGTVRVWDLATGTPAGELAGHTGSVDAVACTVLPGGQPVAVTGSAMARCGCGTWPPAPPPGSWPATPARWTRWRARCCPAGSPSRSPALPMAR